MWQAYTSCFAQFLRESDGVDRWVAVAQYHKLFEVPKVWLWFFSKSHSKVRYETFIFLIL